MVRSCASGFDTCTGFGSIHGIGSPNHVRGFDCGAAEHFTQHNRKFAASSPPYSRQSPASPPQDKNNTAIAPKCKLGSREAPQFVYLAVSVPKHRELRVLFGSMRTACAVCSAFVLL